MIAEKLVSDDLIPLRTSDTGEEALEMMNEFYVRHLPIVNNRQLLGLISEDDILDFDATEAVGSYSLSLTRPYVKSSDHIYEVMRILAESFLTLVPVVDEENNYIGVITQESLLRYFANTTAFAEHGSILVLEVQRHDYSLTEIARIIESENVLILSVFIASDETASTIDITIKTNAQNLQAVIATFERFNYNIKASFNEADYMDSLKERYDSLMMYLNV